MIFHVREAVGVVNQKGDANLLFGISFAQNCMKMKKKLM